MKEFLQRKNIVISAKRYGIDALGAMAQGLFCSLLIGTIIKTLGQQLSAQFLVDIGQFAFEMSGPAMAVAIGYALKADPMVLFSLTGVGWAANKLGGAGHLESELADIDQELGGELLAQSLDDSADEQRAEQALGHGPQGVDAVALGRDDNVLPP